MCSPQPSCYLHSGLLLVSCQMFAGIQTFTEEEGLSTVCCKLAERYIGSTVIDDVLCSCRNVYGGYCRFQSLSERV